MSESNTSTSTSEQIRLLIEDLAKESAAIRMTVRAALVDLGQPAIAALVLVRSARAILMRAVKGNACACSAVEGLIQFRSERWNAPSPPDP